jgi:hypothetical protein
LRTSGGGPFRIFKYLGKQQREKKIKTKREKGIKKERKKKRKERKRKKL